MKNTKFLVKVIRGTRAAEYVQRSIEAPSKQPSSATWHWQWGDWPPKMS